MSAPLHFGLACAAAVALSGCAMLELPTPETREARKYRQQHEDFRAQEGWRKLTYRQADLMSQADAKNSAVRISLAEQRGLLLVRGAVAMDFPVATGKSSHPTPPGSYKIIEKKQDHASNLYGRIVSATGETLVSDADARTDVMPEGGNFVGAPMPYWMRITPTGIGMHVGYVPGRPASHGCIRLKRDTAVQLFSILERGSPVSVDAGTTGPGPSVRGRRTSG